MGVRKDGGAAGQSGEEQWQVVVRPGGRGG